MAGAKVIIHGGAGRALLDPTRRDAVKESLQNIRDAVWKELVGGASAEDAVTLGCKMLEDDPLFNAGTGSVLQRDGQIRMSASFMSGSSQAISGVINVERVQNPIVMARHLQTSRDRIIAGPGTHDLARELAIPVYDPVTSRRLAEWVRERDAATMAEQAEVAGTNSRNGTIGVVAMDIRGRLAAGTSTGGRGFERLGRVSDSATPAGTYATVDCAVSCTGIGEDIMDEGFATRVVVRCEDGAHLADAMAKSLRGAVTRERKLAAICITKHGVVGWCKSTEMLLAAWQTADATKGDTMDVGLAPMSQIA